MQVLGAILAGGRSRRFGSDKALAYCGPHRLIDRTMAALQAQTDGIVMCGRDWPHLLALSDRPAPGLGPLGGLNAALHYAAAQGFDAVLCVPVDVHPLPDDLRRRLEGQAPRVLASQHAIGFWPSELAIVLGGYLAQGHRAVGRWADQAGAIRVHDADLALVNVNTRADLSTLVA
jgi:molybdopterin-guanine dinucleotide biosynthesis protein A